MALSNYLEVEIGDQELEITDPEQINIGINYALESADDFQRKASSSSLNVQFPATLKNQQAANTFHNPSVDDMSPEQARRNYQAAIIRAAGIELLRGKALLINGTKTSIPEFYEYAFYGNNADWMIDLKEKTMYDFLKDISFVLNPTNISNSFAFDGTNEALPYVFAPVRYRGFMDIFNSNDQNVSPEYLRPSISPYWIIYWAFKSVGYRIKSDFMDSPAFRRLVMPWCWGNFLTSEGTKLDIHRFLAKSTNDTYIDYNYGPGPVNLAVTNDLTDGAYDNNNEYSLVGGTKMTWEYKAPDFGLLDVTLSCQVQYESSIVGSNSAVRYEAWWYHYDAIANTTTLFKKDVILYATGRNFVITQNSDFATKFATHSVRMGDKIICELMLYNVEGRGLGARSNLITHVQAYQIEYFRIPIGGTINFNNYIGFQKHKFLDLLAGIVDAFDFSFSTDNINKVVTIEPTHPYTLNGVRKDGYFKENDWIDWEDKRELSDKTKMTLFNNYEREVTFKYKDDTNDGLLKKLQDRNQAKIGNSKYIFPNRFKEGKKDYENRFFAPTVHYDIPQFKGITGVAPQVVCMVPENISNTSNSESENTFLPKLCWYKGNVSGYGGWKFNGTEYTTFPFMFAVNYKPGGHTDPNLSYSDENINGVIAPGLVKIYFWQRLAIMRNGQYYDGPFKLNNNDVIGAHREYKIVEGQRFELVEISDFRPIREELTRCALRKWSPIIQADADSTYPSENSVEGTVPLAENDIKYIKAQCLISDIPQ